MDTYNDTKNAEYKTPQNKTSKVAFLFFLRELKKMINIIKMIIIINHLVVNRPVSPPMNPSSIIRSIIITSSPSIIPRPKKKFHSPYNQSIIIRKKNSQQKIHQTIKDTLIKKNS